MEKQINWEMFIDLRKSHIAIVLISGSISLIIREEHGIHYAMLPLNHTWDDDIDLLP